MGEAKQRKLAGTYHKPTAAEDAANLARLKGSTAMIDPDIERFLLGHEVQLTEEQKEEAYIHIGREFDLCQLGQKRTH